MTSLGTVATLYGVWRIDGANFSFSVNNGPSQSCTCWWNNTETWYQSQLCSISGLDAEAQHTLTITHTDLNGRWLSFDYLE